MYVFYGNRVIDCTTHMIKLPRSAFLDNALATMLLAFTLFYMLVPLSLDMDGGHGLTELAEPSSYFHDSCCHISDLVLKYTLKSI